MNELLQLLMDRTGMSEQQARSALGVVAGFLHDRLPAPLMAQLEGFLGSSSEAGASGESAEAATSGILGGVASKLGGLFGSKETH